MEDIEELTRRVHDAPDLLSRAAILDLDLPALARASRRFIASTWSFGIAVAIVVGGVPTARFLTLVADHPVASYAGAWIQQLIIGVAFTLVLFWVSGIFLTFACAAVSYALPANQTARLVVQDGVASILVPGVAALPWLWFAQEPLFVYGTIAGAALAALPLPRNYDFVAALAANKPRIGAAIARQQRAGIPSTLVGGRSRWLTLQVMGNILAAPFGLLLILRDPWWLIVVIVISFATRTTCLALESRERFRTAVFVQFGAGIAVAALAAVIAGGALWPIVNWVQSSVPA